MPSINCSTHILEFKVHMLTNSNKRQAFHVHKSSERHSDSNISSGTQQREKSNVTCGNW
uniref:Uncharacterized protein n=1 Tax=Rhizophora mucronata TaxID=61149 RepID=A0A2P2Q1N5_RHIMU